MTGGEYFGMIVFILMGLTFVALVLIFLYMIYGEKEEESPSSKMALSRDIINHVLLFSIRFLAMS